MSSTDFSKNIDPFGQGALVVFGVNCKRTPGLAPSSWPLPCPWLARAIPATVSHLRSFPRECLCLHPSSVEFGPARWSQRISELSRSSGIAIELREGSLRQASLSQDKARRHGDSASIGACRRPTLGRDPMNVFLHSCCCADCAGAATSCCTLLDAAVTMRLLGALSLERGCSLRDTRSAATPICWSETRRLKSGHGARRLRMIFGARRLRSGGNFSPLCHVSVATLLRGHFSISKRVQRTGP